MTLSEAVSFVALIVAVIGPLIAWYASSKVYAYRIERAETDIRELRDWKHDHCEPVTRYVQFLQIEKPWEKP